MTYDERDLLDEDLILVRPKEKKKSSSFEYCKWAAGDWEARFYAWTPAHRRECEQMIKQMTNNPAWFKVKVKKDRRQLARDNKARG